MEQTATLHRQPTDNEYQASAQIALLDRFEPAMSDYETFVAQQEDIGHRIRDLLNLTFYYHREFGVHFEKRHAYRDQLHRVLIGEVATIEEARLETRARYAVTEGLGLPRLERLGRVGIAA